MTGKFLFCLALLACSTFCAASAASAVTMSNTTADTSVQGTAAKQNTVRSDRREVVNIVIDKMENGYIYAKDGRKFQLNSSTKIISNKGRSNRVRTAELTFQGGYLITAIIK